MLPNRIYVCTLLLMPAHHLPSAGLMTGRLGYEDNLPSGSRDWNEEFQIVKELPKKTLPQRVDRERSHFKVNSDFVWAATRGAQLVVDGCLMPINPGEETK